jgi:hypothetical protein
VLQTDSAGVLSWIATPSGGGSSLTNTATQSGRYVATAGQNVLFDANAATATGTPTFTTSSTSVSFAAASPAVGVELVLTTTGALPAGFALLTRYFVLTSSNPGGAGNTTLAATRGGTAISAGSAGSGTHTATYRSFAIVLPASPTAGQQVGVELRTAHASRSAMLDFNGATLDGSTDYELMRLIIRGERLVFEAVSSSVWKLVTDGRIAQQCILRAAAALSIPQSTSYAVPLDTNDLDNASLGTTGTGAAITTRRKCIGSLKTIGHPSASAGQWSTYFFVNGLEFWPATIISGVVYESMTRDLFLGAGTVYKMAIYQTNASATTISTYGIQAQMSFVETLTR